MHACQHSFSLVVGLLGNVITVRWFLTVFISFCCIFFLPFEGNNALDELYTGCILSFLAVMERVRSKCCFVNRGLCMYVSMYRCCMYNVVFWLVDDGGESNA